MGTISGAKRILRDLKRAGYEGYIVGGAVRDYLLKRPITDVDITTNARPYQVAKIFRTKPTGLKYGTVTVLLQKDTYEVTTYRVDGTYLDGRHPEAIAYSDSVIEDVKRRDFRINGLLMDERGEIFDHVHGKDDLRERLIQTIGDPVERFNEDALRMMRAFYFQAKLGFRIEEKTLRAISDHKGRLTDVAMERIQVELIKMLKGKYAKKAIESVVSTGVHAVLPGLKKGMEYVTTMDEVPFVDAFFTLCFTLEKDVPAAWPFSNKHRHRYRTASMLANSYASFDPVTLYTYGLDLCLLANKVSFMLKRAPNLKSRIERDFENLPIKSELDLKVRAPELIRLLDRKPGAWLSALQKDMVKKVLRNELKNDKDALIEYAMKSVND
ncbi:MAG: CCA tRNA nucleotidyltransferase [Acholeplasmataceae bacterium]